MVADPNIRPADKDAFISNNAKALVKDLEIKVQRQREQLGALSRSKETMRKEREKLLSSRDAVLAALSTKQDEIWKLDDTVNDLETTRQQLDIDRERKTEAVRQFLSKVGHDICQEERRALAVVFGLEPPLPPNPPSELDMAAGCVLYRKGLFGQAKPFDPIETAALAGEINKPVMVVEAYIARENVEIKLQCEGKDKQYLGIFQKGYQGPLFRVDLPYVNQWRIQESYHQLMHRFEVFHPEATSG